MASSNLREELAEKFGDGVASDEKLLSECMNICQIYNLSAEDLLYKWEALNFNSINTSSISMFTMDSAHALKARIQRDLAAMNSKKQQARPNMTASVAGRATAFMRMNAARSAGAPVQVKLEPRSEVLPEQSNKAVDLSSRIGVTYQGPRNDEKSRRKRIYRYMYEKVSERSEALDDRIDEIADIIREHYNISELGDPEASTDEEITVVGRITLDSESSSSGSVKLNEASLCLESSRMMGSGARVPLRFDSLVELRRGAQGSGGIGLFPGAIVALRGKNGGGGWFLVTEILAVPPLKSSLRSKREPVEAPFSMCIASGPFTPDTDLNYKPLRNLLERLKSTKPSVVFLIGPFIDVAHPRIKAGDIDHSPSELFNQYFTENLRDFLAASPTTLILILPNIRDIISDHAVFPQCELGSEFSSDPRIQLVPNPCQFSINGLSFATSSVDVLFHLRKEEFFKKCQEVESISSSDVRSGSDSMSNLCRHLLEQRSFYPIFPVPLDLSHEVNLDVSHSDGVKLGDDGEEECAPDILIVPSRLKHFSKVVHDTVAINPSFLTKGTFSMLTFQGRGSGPLKDRIKVDIVKLEDLNQ